MADDVVNHPSHYTQGKFEVIEVIEDWQLGFHLGNVVKYVARAHHKGSELTDLQKARWYLNRKITMLEQDKAQLLNLTYLKMALWELDQQIASLEAADHA